jgi:hypothetical protein
MSFFSFLLLQNQRTDLAQGRVGRGRLDTSGVGEVVGKG